MSASPTVSIVVPSRTGRIDGLRAQLARQTLQGWQLVPIVGIAPPARARNLGAAQATGEVLIFLDDDIEQLDPRLLEDMVRGTQLAEPHAVIAVRWRPPAGANALQRWQQRESFVPPIEPVNERLGRIAWDQFGTACCAMRRVAFRELGGFDESLTSAEDVELWYRATRAGGGTYVLRDRWIEHEPPRTVGAMLRKVAWHEWGNAQMARKHPDSGYRMVLRSRGQAAAYLLIRTLALVPLMFLKVSYRYRRPTFAFRPMAVLVSYLGAWVYCVSWFTPPAGPAPRTMTGVGSSAPSVSS